MTENELTLHNPVVESSQEDLPTSSPSGSTNSALCKVSTSEDSTSPSQCACSKKVYSNFELLVASNIRSMAMKWYS